MLRTPAEPVRDFDAELRRLVKDLTETMLDAPGAGLAAPQIGVGLRVFTYHVDDHEPGHLINPSLDLSKEEDEDDEGCLSFPGLVYPVKRAWGVVAKGFNMHGDPVTIEGTELLARCIQHETDHLDGILFIDRMDDGPAQGGHEGDPRRRVVGRPGPAGARVPARDPRPGLLTCGLPTCWPVSPDAPGFRGYAARRRYRHLTRCWRPGTRSPRW